MLETEVRQVTKQEASFKKIKLKSKICKIQGAKCKEGTQEEDGTRSTRTEQSTQTDKGENKGLNARGAID